MLAKFRSVVSKLRVRQREAARRHAQRRTLRAEPLEGRLLMTGDSWVVPTGIPNTTGSYFPVAADDVGNVYVAATRYDGSATQPDICLMKYLPSGQEDATWTIDLRFLGYQNIKDVAVSDDSVYIIGMFEGTVNFDPAGGAAGNLQSQGGFDGYLAKYGADGAFQWAQRWGGTGDDSLDGIALSETCVYVTGNRVISVKGPNVLREQWVTSVSNLGAPRWEEMVGPIWGYPTDIAVFTPAGAPTNVYISGTGESGGYVNRLTETVDGTDAFPRWTYALGANTLIAGCDGIAVGDGDSLPSLYVLKGVSGGSDQALLKIRDEGDIGSLVWSTPMGAYPWGVTLDGTTDTVYVAGSFSGQKDVSGTLLTSRGSSDGFLARYNADGQLLAAQRMGGTATEQWESVAVGNGCVYAGGHSNSMDGDFPAGLPGAVSAFVSSNSQRQMFVMKLETAAPIVQVEDPDIAVLEDIWVTLTATTSAGDLVWYEKNSSGVSVPLVDGNPDLPGMNVKLPVGVHQISAVATEWVTENDETTERIGMAGVVVTVVAVPTTKFYVVNDATTNQTYEYSPAGSLVESYNLSTANTTPRGAASTFLGDKTWVVDANRNVYVYNTSGTLLGSWTAGTLPSNATVEGITTNGTDVWIVDAKTDRVYKYMGAATRLTGSQTAASSFSLNTANTSPKDLVTDGTALWVVNDSTTDKVFKYNMFGTLLGSWTISGGGGSPTGITLDPSNVSQDLWVVDNGTDKVYQYTNGRTVTSGTGQTATMIFSLAPGNTNPQGIADPPAPSSLVTTETVVLAESVASEVALVDNDTALEDLYYYEPPRNVRVDHTPRVASHTAVIDVSAPDYTVGAAPNYLTGDNRWATDDDSESDVEDLFAEWDSDRLELLSLPDLGM